MKFSFNVNLYSKEALFKTAYRYIDDYYVHLDLTEENYIVTVEGKTPQIPQLSEKEFINDMLIEETRRIINTRTENIREMIFARAMASTIIDDREMIDDNNNVDADEILMDWFDKNE